MRMARRMSFRIIKQSLLSERDEGKGAQQADQTKQQTSQHDHPEKKGIRRQRLESRHQNRDPFIFSREVCDEENSDRICQGSASM